MQSVFPVPDSGFARAYVLSGAEGIAAVDVGSIGCADDVEAFIGRELGRSLDELKFITATHFHIDHIGGIATLLARCPPETVVLFHPLVRQYLAGTRALSPLRNWRNALVPASWASAKYVRKLSHLFADSLAGIPLPLFGNSGFPVDRARISFFRKTGQFRYPLGFGDWEVVETPGHTEDSVSFFNTATREFLSGDFIVNLRRGFAGRVNRFCWSCPATRESFAEARREIHPLTLYPGHGEPLSHESDVLAGVDPL